eukprot:8285010-Lingulodinium_polyedra.AAC.1
MPEADRAGPPRGDVWSCSPCSMAWARLGWRWMTPYAPCAAGMRLLRASSLRSMCPWEMRSSAPGPAGPRLEAGAHAYGLPGTSGGCCGMTLPP